MNDPLQRLIVAWSESPQRRKKLTARQLLRLSRGSLRQALNATKAGSGATRPNILGMFLNANKDMLCRGYYIRTDFDAHNKQFEYFLEKVSDDELRRLAFEASIAQDERRETDRQNRLRRATPKPRTLIYLSPPNADWFTHQRTAQKIVDNLCAAHFDASIDWGPGGEMCAVRIQKSDVNAVKEYCRTHRMEYHRVREITQASKQAKCQSEQVWDQRLQTWLPKPSASMPLGYAPEAKFIRRALELDRHRGADPIHLTPVSQAWSPFNTVGCTPRVTTYTDADAFDAYRKASKEAADFGY